MPRDDGVTHGTAIALDNHPIRSGEQRATIRLRRRSATIESDSTLGLAEQHRRSIVRQKAHAERKHRLASRPPRLLQACRHVSRIVRRGEPYLWATSKSAAFTSALIILVLLIAQLLRVLIT